MSWEISESDTNKDFTNSYHFWNWSKDVYIDIYGYLLCMCLYFDIKSTFPNFQELPDINIFYWRSAIFLAFCTSSNPVVKFLVDQLFLCISFKILHEIILQCNPLVLNNLLQFNCLYTWIAWPIGNHWFQAVALSSFLCIKLQKVLEKDRIFQTKSWRKLYFSPLKVM